MVEDTTIRDLDISEILNEVAEKGLVGEATVPKTVPTGKYVVRYNGYKGYEDENNGTPFVSINVQFEQDGTRKGSGFIKATWKKERNPNTGKLTRRAQLFGQLVKALDQTEDTPVSKVMDAFQSSLLGAFVIESLMTPQGEEPRQFIQIGEEHTERDGQTNQVTRAEANDLIARGWTPYNGVVNLYKLKG